MERVTRHQATPAYEVVTADGLRRQQLALEALISAAGAAGVTQFNGRSGNVSLLNSDVLTALGFTPQQQDTQLTDLAGLTYTGNSLKVVRVNAGETGFELATVSSGGLTDGDYGDIVVSGGGTAINIDSAVLSAFGRTLVDDANAAAARATLGLVIGTDVQAFDSDLSAIAALSTTSYGRSLLTAADASALRTLAGLGSAALNNTGDFQPIDADLTAIAALTTTSYGRSLLTAADASALRTLAAVVIGTDVQAFDSDLAAIAALATTSFGRSLLTLADATAFANTVADQGLSSAKVSWTRGSTKTIAAGVITVTSANGTFAVDTEGAAATDDLDTISGGTQGQRILIRPASAARTINLTTAGNIHLLTPVLLGHTTQFAELMWDNSLGFWEVITLGIRPAQMSLTTAQVDFGTSGDTDYVEVTVAATWVTATSKITVTPAPPTTTDHDPEDNLLEQLHWSVQSISPGASFVLGVHAPCGTWGRYDFHCIGA